MNRRSKWQFRKIKQKLIGAIGKMKYKTTTLNRFLLVIITILISGCASDINLYRSTNERLNPSPSNSPFLGDQRGQTGYSSPGSFIQK